MNLGEGPSEDAESAKWNQEPGTGLRGKPTFKEAPEKNLNKSQERERSRSQVGESCG